MIFLITYRTPKGLQEQLSLEAQSRTAVFGELGKRGITNVIRIEESSSKVKPRKTSSTAGKATPSTIKWLLAGLISIAIITTIIVVFWFLNKAQPTVTPIKEQKASVNNTNSISAPAKTPDLAACQRTKTAKDIAAEFSAQAKEFIKKATTNETQWIVPPLDPNDPDNALRTRVCQELGSLLSIEPGEPMPPFPYSFMLEDDMHEAKARGEDVGEIDNGNKTFLESLAKFKIVAKETDDKHRLEHKEKLVAAQVELLDSIDKGLSVNDTIRAAYEFRKRAYEMRTELSNVLRENAAEETDITSFKRQLEMVNLKLEEEGIKTIPIEEILPDYEDDPNDQSLYDTTPEGN